MVLVSLCSVFAVELGIDRVPAETDQGYPFAAELIEHSSSLIPESNSLKKKNHY